MTEAKFEISARFDLWGDLLAKLSDEGLSDLAGAISGERYRREQIKKLEAI